MPSIAGLPMYDWPEVADLWDRYWCDLRDILREAGLDAPDALTRDRDPVDLWCDPDLIVGQTCGWPLVQGHAGRARVFARSHHTLSDVTPGNYVSAIVVREGTRIDKGALIPVINGPDSLSGALALWHYPSDEGLIATRAVMSGSHRASIAAVRDGRADIAAIDIVSWNLACSFCDVSGLVVWDRTAGLPSLPFITSPAMTAAQGSTLQIAMNTVMQRDEHAALRGLMLIDKIIPASRNDYQVLHTLGPLAFVAG